MADILIVYTTDEKIAESFTPGESDALAKRLGRQMKRYGVAVLPPGWGASLVSTACGEGCDDVECSEDSSLE